MLIFLGLNFVKLEKSFNFVDVAFQYQGLAFNVRIVDLCMFFGGGPKICRFIPKWSNTTCAL